MPRQLHRPNCLIVAVLAAGAASTIAAAVLHPHLSVVMRCILAACAVLISLVALEDIFTGRYNQKRPGFVAATAISLLFTLAATAVALATWLKSGSEGVMFAIVGGGYVAALILSGWVLTMSATHNLAEWIEYLKRPSLTD
jgi:hypothetical protein